MTEEKRNTDRKRNIIILIEKYLLTLGYIDSVTKIEQETNITLEKWDTADNIDLFMVFLEYEHYHEMKFGKVPKVVKKVEDSSKFAII
jgi:katanin p60 ATPase-containing subunit A1